MEFAIQVSNPASFGVIEGNMSAAEALETIFPLNTEFALLIWNNVYVPLNYKYDVSYIFEDIVSLMEVVSESLVGHTTIYWPSNSFRAKWNVSWNDIEVTVHSKWESVLGGTESLLNQNPRISLSKARFLGEFAQLVATCLKHVKKRDSSCSLNLTRFEEILNLVDERGILYQS